MCPSLHAVRRTLHWKAVKSVRAVCAFLSSFGNVNSQTVLGFFKTGSFCLPTWLSSCISPIWFYRPQSSQKFSNEKSKNKEFEIAAFHNLPLVFLVQSYEKLARKFFSVIFQLNLRRLFLFCVFTAATTDRFVFLFSTFLWIKKRERGRMERTIAND